MKRIAAVLILIGVVVSLAGAQGFGTGQSHDEILSALPIEPLNGPERDALLYMIEEEKMARDVYLYLAEVWNLRTFSNIARSEEQHIAAVLSLLERYEVDVPSTLGEPGRFENEVLRAMYADLIARGETSLEGALRVGATIEDVDLADLNEKLSAVDNEDITMVFKSLIAGSENHMRSFVRQLDRLGATYTPQHIDAEYYGEILTGSQGGPQRAVGAAARTHRPTGPSSAWLPGAS